MGSIAGTAIVDKKAAKQAAERIGRIVVEVGDVTALAALTLNVARIAIESHDTLEDAETYAVAFCKALLGSIRTNWGAKR